jgi:hypothetical protein
MASIRKPLEDARYLRQRHVLEVDTDEDHRPRTFHLA